MKGASGREKVHMLVQDLTPIALQPTISAIIDPPIVFVDQTVSVDFLNTTNTSLTAIDISGMNRDSFVYFHEMFRLLFVTYKIKKHSVPLCGKLCPSTILLYFTVCLINFFFLLKLM